MPKETVIFDLDGTLADVEHRRIFIERRPQDWAAFYRACTQDAPNVPVIETARALSAAGYEIVILTGRSDEVRAETLSWLKLYSVPFDQLFMRRDGDFTPDEKLKAMWLENFDSSRVLGVFEDRPKVVRMWREKGIFCFDCGRGKEF